MDIKTIPVFPGTPVKNCKEATIKGVRALILDKAGFDASRGYREKMFKDYGLLILYDKNIFEYYIIRLNNHEAVDIEEIGAHPDAFVESEDVASIEEIFLLEEILEIASMAVK